jgi:hypothetical protein
VVGTLDVEASASNDLVMNHVTMAREDVQQWKRDKRVPKRYSDDSIMLVCILRYLHVCSSCSKAGKHGRSNSNSERRLGLSGMR